MDWARQDALHGITWPARSAWQQSCTAGPPPGSDGAAYDTRNYMELQEMPEARTRMEKAKHQEHSMVFINHATVHMVCLMSPESVKHSRGRIICDTHIWYAEAITA